MRMGIREFRRRVPELAAASSPVIVTNHDRVVGTFVPNSSKAVLGEEEYRTLIEDTAAFQRVWKAATPDWRERLASIGIVDEEDLHGLQERSRDQST